MRLSSNLVPATLALLFLTAAASLRMPAQQPVEPVGRVVLVLPFDNRSGNPSLNWIGDSFPDTLDKRLNSVGFLTISHDDRSFALDHLGLPAGFRPSRATTIQIARQLDANYVIVGSYNVRSGPPGGPAGDQISIQAQVLSIDALTLSPPIDDGSELNRLFDAENAIAWKVARQMEPSLSVSEQTFLASGAVPLPAFENYIRGTNSAVPADAIKRLQTAVEMAPAYPAALLALGKLQYAQRDFAAAAATLARVPPGDRLALEANFYLGLSQFNSANYPAAQKAFAFVAERLPLPEVINDEAVAISRQGKDGSVLFRRASVADPSAEDYHYNLAVSLYRQGQTAQAIDEVATALKLKPTDNEAEDLSHHLKAATPGSRLSATDSDFSPVERINRIYSETGFRQAAFQLDQLRRARLALLPAPQRATEYAQAGRDYLAQGLIPEAESQFQSALQANPDSYEAHAGLAAVREASGSPDEAREQALLSIRLHANAPAWVVIARLDIAQNQLSAASDAVTHALHLDPNNSAAITLRSTLQLRGEPVLP